MRPFLIHLTQDVEEEGIYVIVQRLVIQKELGEETKVLTVDFLIFAVNLVHRKVIFTIDLSAGWRAVFAITGENRCNKSQWSEERSRERKQDYEEVDGNKYIFMVYLQWRDSLFFDFMYFKQYSQIYSLSEPQ